MQFEILRSLSKPLTKWKKICAHCSIRKVFRATFQQKYQMPTSDSATALIATSPEPSPVALQLRLLATSDLHAHIMAWDYYSDLPSENCGLARTAALIAQARSEAVNSLLFDNGDFLNGNPLGDFAARAFLQKGWQGHPVIAAMNLLKYDGATLGNHDFSEGISLLTASIALANFPVVAANIKADPASTAQSSTLHFTPYMLLDRQFEADDGQFHQLRIGIVGFLPPQTLVWEHRHLKGRYVTRGILPTARELIPQMRALGADVVIALSHSGIDCPGKIGNRENVSLALAAVEGIDATIAGHTHLIFPPSGPARQVQAHPIVMPGFYGSHLGVIDLKLERGASGWRVVAHHEESRPIASRNSKTGQLIPLVASVPEIEAAARPCHDALRNHAQTIIGESKLPLHSFFAMIQPTRALSLVADATIENVRAALVDSEYAVLPILAAVAPFKAGGRGGAENYTDVPVGPLTMRHAADLYIHPNSIVALLLKGSDIALWLERAASLFYQIKRGARDAILIDTDFPAFNFDMIYGLTYQIDLAAPPRFDAKGKVINPYAIRIVGLKYHGVPLKPGADVVLATNSYRSAGGSGFAGTTPDRVIFEGYRPTREVLEHYISKIGTVQAAQPTNWSFRSMPDTTVVFDSAPSASRHIHEVPNLRIQPLKLQGSGFQRFRLCL